MFVLWGKLYIFKSGVYFTHSITHAKNQSKSFSTTRDPWKFQDDRNKDK